MYGPKKTSPGSIPEHTSSQAPLAGAAHPEKRRSPRKKVNYFGVLTKIVKGEPHRNWLVKVEDISLHGLCLRPVTNALGFLHVGDRAMFSVLLGERPQEHLVIRHIHRHGLGSEFLRRDFGDLAAPGPAPNSDQQ